MPLASARSTILAVSLRALTMGCGSSESCRNLGLNTRLLICPGDVMKILSALLAVPALAVFALVGSATLPHGGRAEAASCNPLTFHDERYEGGVCCFTDHFHSGTGAGETSRAKAVSTAISAWEDFVWLEYGSAYQRWSIAHSKSVSCSNSNGWSCTVEARACHRG